MHLAVQASDVFSCVKFASFLTCSDAQTALQEQNNQISHTLASKEQELLRVTEHLLHTGENLAAVKSDLSAMKERCLFAESQLIAKDEEIMSLQKIEVSNFSFNRFFPSFITVTAT